MKTVAEHDFIGLPTDEAYMKAINSGYDPLVARIDFTLLQLPKETEIKQPTVIFSIERQRIVDAFFLNPPSEKTNELLQSQN